MFATAAPFFILFASAVLSVRADPNPNNPGPGDVFIEGKSCTIGWDADSTSVWKTMNIDLMTGDNFDMVFLTNVATVDGTNPRQNTFSFTCPQVTPRAPIYFYQFTSLATPNKTWTGRFTITDSASDIATPLHATQPDGAKIPWGVGSLVGKSSSATSSAPGLVPSTSGTSASAMPSTTPGSSVVSASPSDTSSPSASYSTNSASATPSTVSTTGTNSAAAGLAGMFSIYNTVFQTGLALGLSVLGFSVVF